jgi:hypothetical protein
MRFNATIQHKAALAFYEIYREAPGIYSAELTYYEGATCNMPPIQINLVRGIRQWAGSVDDKKILNSLGAIIENNMNSSPLLGYTENNAKNWAGN